MAVYKRTYKRYEGVLTSSWSRWSVIPRYAFEDLSRSKFLTWFYVACFLYPLVCAIIIYLRHNLNAFKLFNVDFSQIITIKESFFGSMLGFQSMLAFFLAAFVGPGLISADVSNNAIPLYLSRPLSRAEYIWGKMSVLVVMLSMMTWVPALLLFLLQGSLDEGTWMKDNGHIAGAIFWGSWIWIVTLSLLALALSAWVKWRPAASALMFGTFFVAAGFGEAVNRVLDTHWGNLINLPGMMGTVWTSFFHEAPSTFFGVERGETPLWAAWSSLIGACMICLYLLARKVRGCEVVR